MVRLYTNRLFAANVALYLRSGYAIDREEPFWGGVKVHMSKRVLPANQTRLPLRQRLTPSAAGGGEGRRSQASTRAAEHPLARRRRPASPRTPRRSAP